MANSSKAPIRLVPITSQQQLSPQNLQQGAEAGTQAFAPDPLFMWMRPHRTPDYFEQLQRYFENRLIKVACQQGKDHLVLAIRSDEDGRNEEVLGWAIWERTLGPGEVVGGDFRWGVERQTDAESSSDTAKDDEKDPAYDEERLAAFVQSWERGEGNINRALRSAAPARLREEEQRVGNVPDDADFAHIKLFLIAVSPKFQRQGIGGILVRWGIDKATEQGVPIVMGASPAGEGLYRKCGFENLGVQLVYAKQEDEAIYGRLNDEILAWWPPERYGGDSGLAVRG